MIHIGLNAHLLSSHVGYRSAGIHNVIHRTLLHVPAVLPADWRLTAMVGKHNRATYAGVMMRRAGWDTESPLRRIVWEQVAQPGELRDFDLYHAMAFVAPLILHKPMVVTVYDLTFMRYPERLSRARRLYLRYMTDLTCQRAKRILAISHSTKRDLVDLLGVAPEKVDVTPLGYDTDLFKPLPEADIAAFKQQHNLPERFWFYLGTIEPRKNLPMLLKAYAALPKNERLPLILAGGKGWGYDDVMATIETYQLQDAVSLPGFLPTDSMALWYNSAEIFIYPSVFEGFGLPVLEAMACGTPVLTSNVSSLPEVAAGAGLCLPPHDIEAWTQALHQAYHDADWREEARTNGLKKAAQFQWQTMATLVYESYRRALSQ